MACYRFPLATLHNRLGNYFSVWFPIALIDHWRSFKTRLILADSRAQSPADLIRLASVSDLEKFLFSHFPIASGSCTKLIALTRVKLQLRFVSCGTLIVAPGLAHCRSNESSNENWTFFFSSLCELNSTTQQLHGGGANKQTNDWNKAKSRKQHWREENDESFADRGLLLALLSTSAHDRLSDNVEHDW